MSVRLTSYASLPVDAKPQALVIGDVDLPGDENPPLVGILALYGSASTTDALHRIRSSLAEDEKYTLRTIELEVDFGDVEPGRYDIERLYQDRMVHLGRLERNAEAEMRSLIADLLSTSGETSDPRKVYEAGVMRRPDLLPEIFASKKFKAEIVVFDLEDPAASNGRVSMALLISAENIVQAIVRGLPDTEILWPEKLPLNRVELEKKFNRH
jgi:hypothetical protein